ncbi:MAG: SCO family protein [Phycisphaerae bacterium]
MAAHKPTHDDSEGTVGIVPAEGPPAGSHAAWRGVVVILGIAVVILGVWRVASPLPHPTPAAPQLPRIKPVPEFALTEASGATVTRDTLLGSPWVADFIFTSCPGPCPKLSQRMLAIQRALIRAGVSGRLVSFSVDPQRDRPSVLQKYAQRFKANSDRWWFLTGEDEESMWNLVSEGFLQAVFAGDEDHHVEHSTYLIVVGKSGYIRSVHQGLDPDQSVSGLVDAIVTDLRALDGEPDQPQ